MAAGDIAECQGGTERDAGSRIIPVHDRTHVVAAGIEALDRRAVRSQDPRMLVRLEAYCRAQIRRKDPKRKERRALDRRDTGIGRAAGVAEVALIDRAATTEIRIQSLS